jgi:hypothetical protein
LRRYEHGDDEEDILRDIRDQLQQQTIFLGEIIGILHKIQVELAPQERVSGKIILGVPVDQ